MVSRFRFIFNLLFLAAGCSILLSGCEPQKPAGPPEKLTIATPTIAIAALIKIAEAKDFFREEGLDVTLQLHAFGKIALQSLLDGNADLAAAAETPFMFAIMKGVMLSVLATTETSNRDVVIVVRKDKEGAAVTDLKGLRVGVPLGTSADYYLDTYLVLNALSRKDVILVDMKPEEMLDALTQGKVDAVSVWQPHIAYLRNALGDHGIILHSDTIYTETFNLVSTRALTLQRPEAIRRLLRALVKAEGFVAANPGESKRIMAEFVDMDGDLLAGIWSDYQFNLSLNQSLLVTLEDQGRWAIKNGLTDRRDLPNFLEALYLDGLKAVKPDAVRIIK